MRRVAFIQSSSIHRTLFRWVHTGFMSLKVLNKIHLLPHKDETVNYFQDGSGIFFCKRCKRLIRWGMLPRNTVFACVYEGNTVFKEITYRVAQERRWISTSYWYNSFRFWQVFYYLESLNKRKKEILFLSIYKWNDLIRQSKCFSVYTIWDEVYNVIYLNFDQRACL